MGRLILVSVASILLFTPVCLARTWSVPSSECPTIQAGIDSASVGDTVLVAAGTYTGEGNKNLDFGGTDLVLLSEAGPELTIIDCEGSGRGFNFHSGETAASVVEGFTITNADLWDYGGGMRCAKSHPTVSNCIFSENTAVAGGGIYCDGCSPTVSHCTFSGNSVRQSGGGMWCFKSHPSVSHCIFSGNTARVGGGIRCERCTPSSPTVSHCTFSGNSVSESGGGMFCEVSSPTVSHCTFSGNSARFGGGMRCEIWSPSSPTVSHCTFSGNWGDECGGGMYCGAWPPPTIRNCTFSGNLSPRGGGIYCCGFSILLVRKTIIAYSPVGEAVWCCDTGHAFLTCCDVYGNAGGDWVGYIADQFGINGNFSACPSFCFADGGDFHLCDESPCAPGNHPDGYDCGLIGAWPVGCSCGPSRAEGTTWGAIKAMYR